MILTTLINIDGTAGWVLILLPLFVLAVVVVGVIAGRDRATIEPDAAGAVSPAREPISNMPGHDALRETNVRGTTTLLPKETGQQPEAVSLQAPPAAPATDEAQAPWANVDQNARNGSAISARESELQEAEQRFDDAAVARLSLQLARDLMAGNTPSFDAQTHLRRAIILAARLKDDETHAAARLELGDLMEAEGDLTSACEHWQIARQIFWDKSAKSELADIDRRMTANGCPTDWFLNEF
jgi:hypothetical protein